VIVLCGHMRVSLHLQAVRKTNDSKQEAKEEKSDDVEDQVVVRTGGNNECLAGWARSSRNNLQESEENEGYIQKSALLYTWHVLTLRQVRLP